MLWDGRVKQAASQEMTPYVGDMSASIAPRVGADLRHARERLGCGVDDMAAALRIRAAYLKALEDGRIGDLPGITYASAFLRAYAMALGLDPEEIFRRFKAEADNIDHQTELEFPAPVPSRAIPAGALALLGVVLAISAYAGWYSLSGKGRLPAETVTAVPARLAPLAQQAVPPARPITPALPALPATEPAAATPAPFFLPSQAAAMPLPPPAPPPPIPAAAPPPAAAATPAAESRIAIRAKGSLVWIQVRERGGPVLFDRTLRPGEGYTLPNRPNLVLSTGNALATEFLVDGEITPGLGLAKGVRRELVMDPDPIKDGRLAAQLGGGNGTVTRAQ